MRSSAVTLAVSNTTGMWLVRSSFFKVWHSSKPFFSRHHHIAHDEVGRVCEGLLDALPDRCGLPAPGTDLRCRPPRVCLAHVLVVLHEKQGRYAGILGGRNGAGPLRCFFPCPSRVRCGQGRGGDFVLGRDGQQHLKTRPDTRLAFHEISPRRRRTNFAGEGQAHSGASPAAAAGGGYLIKLVEHARPSCSAGMPMPVSRTLMRQWDWPFCTNWAICKQT